jgi:hypothetical protein
MAKLKPFGASGTTAIGMPPAILAIVFAVLCMLLLLPVMLGALIPRHRRTR